MAQLTGNELVKVDALKGVYDNIDGKIGEVKSAIDGNMTHPRFKCGFIGVKLLNKPTTAKNGRPGDVFDIFLGKKIIANLVVKRGNKNRNRGIRSRDDDLLLGSGKGT